MIHCKFIREQTFTLTTRVVGGIRSPNHLVENKYSSSHALRLDFT